MSDQPVILPKWFSYEGILLAKGQLDHSYTFWTMPIMIFSSVANFGNHPLFYFFSNDVSGGPVATIDVYELSDNYDDNVFDLPFKPDNNIKRKMSDPELSLMHTVASSSSTDLDCIIGGVQFNAETGKDHI